VRAAFQPENELERELAADPDVARGLAWGKPRSSHPEGTVGAHVADLLRKIDSWDESEPRRSELRFLAIVHDALKYQVRGWVPKVGENHHATRARRLAECYTTDERLLAVIEQHDRPYAIWRRTRRLGTRERRAVDRLVRRVPDLSLFLRFVELDGSSEAKNPEPIAWLREELGRRGLLG
jgi:hypothetical protein